MGVHAEKKIKIIMLLKNVLMNWNDNDCFEIRRKSPWKEDL